MPIYEYRCKDCGAVYEKLRRAKDADRDLQCPKCASRNVERTVSAFATSGPFCSPSGGSGFR
ncbi:MAG TPA: zinc ribbon domain-containing protein [Thermopetrobacter sp.]|nr:zinc ribbon domain-containing protein [Thermopetrobacter sp.]